jgi:hypothetical protein
LQVNKTHPSCGLLQRGEDSGTNVIIAYGRGQSGFTTTPLFGRGQSGFTTTPLFGRGQSGFTTTPLLLPLSDCATSANDIAKFVATIAVTVITTETNRLALRDIYEPLRDGWMMKAERFADSL